MTVNGSFTILDKYIRVSKYHCVLCTKLFHFFQTPLKIRERDIKCCDAAENNIDSPLILFQLFMSKGYYQTQLIRTLCSGVVLAKPSVVLMLQ